MGKSAFCSYLYSIFSFQQQQRATFSHMIEIVQMATLLVFTNDQISPGLISEAFGFKSIVPAFLEPSYNISVT